MNKIIPWAVLASIVLSIVALIVAVGGNSQSSGGVFGGIGTRFPNGIAVGSGASVSTAGTLNIGSSGSGLTFIKATTCDLTGNGAIAASSSVSVECAVTGVVSGDLAFMTLATSSLGTISGARASTTAGSVTARLFNWTGAASSVTALGTSTAVLIFRAI